jgi:SAM-dependent methyltransferase
MKTLEKEPFPQLLKDNLAELPYFRGFLRAVEGRYYQHFPLKQPVLDMGCGDGHFAARTFQEKIDFGFDPAFISLEEAKSFDAYNLLLMGRGDRLPFRSGEFSTVVSNSVLEHIPDVDAVLMDIRRILKPSGRLLMTVPNDHFTSNLSIARFFDRIHLKGLAQLYRQFFNKISRHYHPDSAECWKARLEGAGFQIVKTWNYFPPSSLKILEWGHYFGLPNWVNKKIFGKWVLFPNSWYVKLVYRWLYSHYARVQEDPQGAYSFFIAEKRTE